MRTLNISAGFAENKKAVSRVINNSLKSKHSECETVLSLADRALKCLMLYPANHETTRLAVDELWISISEYLDRHGNLDIHIAASQMLVDSEPVGRHSRSMKSLAQQLNRLELHRVLFKPDVDKDQLLIFLMIMCMAPEDVLRAGGVGELLWEKRAAGIAVFQPSLESPSLGSASTVDPIEVIKEFDTTDKAVSAEQLPQSKISGTFDVLSEGFTSRVGSGDIIIVAQNIRQLIFTAFESGVLDVAADALAIIANETVKRRSEPDSHAVLKGILRDAGNPDRIEILLSRIEKEAETSVDRVAQYLAPLGNAAVRTLLDILAVEEREVRRLIVCRLLAAVGKADIESIGDKVRDHRWYLVRNAVIILGRIAGPEVIPYLQRTALHPDRRVRIEVAKALANVGPETFETILQLLKDTDSDIRLEAVRSIGKTGHPKSVETLIDVVKKRDFLGHRTDLKLEAVQVLEKIKAERSIRNLAKMSRNPGALLFPGRARLKEAIINAQTALKAVKTA